MVREAVNVIPLRPKTYERHTKKYDVWLQFDMETRTWKWKVVLRLDPMTFEGVAETEQAARDAINLALKSVKSSLG